MADLAMETQWLWEGIGNQLKKDYGVFFVYDFSASFLSSNDWIARLDYKHEDKDEVKSLLIQGYKNTIHSAFHLRPRIFMNLPSTDWFNRKMEEVELEGPGVNDRLD